MKLEILLFGITTDLIGTSHLQMEVPVSSSVAQFKRAMITSYPQLVHLETYAIAVNETYASDDTVLQENDVIAIIPPVSGG